MSSTSGCRVPTIRARVVTEWTRPALLFEDQFPLSKLLTPWGTQDAGEGGQRVAMRFKGRSFVFISSLPDIYRAECNLYENATFLLTTLNLL